MRIHIWCILAPVFLISVTASLHDNVGQSFYETSQSSSPTPISDYTQSPQPDVLDGMKEIVLYLTPDQVNALQAAGAVVKPYPEDEVDFTSMDQQLPQRIKPERRQHYQMQWNPNQQTQLNPEIQNYYKLLNIQEINDNLSQTAAATIRTTEATTTTPRYRFTSTTTRPRFKEREYPTSSAPNRKASRTNYSNQNSNTERTPFQYYYVNQNFRNTPYNIRTPDNSPFSEFTFDRKTNPNFYSTPSSTITPSPSKTDYSNQNSNIEHTTHFEFYFENKKFKNTPSNIRTPNNSPSTKTTSNSYNNPTPKNNPSIYSTSSPEITPNPYYTPSPKSTPNPYKAPNPKNTPSLYSTPKLNSSFNINSSPILYNTPSRTNTPTPYSTASPYNTPNNFNSATRLQQSPYQPEKIQPKNYFQSNKEVQGNQYHQSPSSAPRAYSTTSTPRPKITPSPKNTPKYYSTPSPSKSSTRLPLSRYEPEKEQSNNYFQTSKEIRRNQYHQSPSSTPISGSTPRPKITPNPKNTPKPYSSPSPYKSSTRLPLSRYEPVKEQPNNYFQSSKEIQGNQYYQSPSSNPTPSPYDSPNNTPSSYSNSNPYKTPTHLPQSLYQSEDKQSNDYFPSSKEIQENRYHQNPANTPSPYSTPSPYKTPTRLPQPLYQSEEKQPIDVQPSEEIQEDQNHQNTPSPYSTPRPYKSPTLVPQSLYHTEEKQSHNFQPNKEIQRNQQPVTATHQNEFSGTTRNAPQNEFTASSTKPHGDENVCTEETTEPEQNVTQRTVEIGNRKVNKYSARNVYKPPVAVQVQVQEAQESVKPQTFAEVPTSYNGQTEPELNSGLEDTTKHKKPLNSDNDHNADLSSSPLQEEQETTTTPALPPLVRKPFEEEDYLSLLLAPLYKHQTISEIVSQHKDDLTRSESNVNSKLQYLTNSQLFNTNEHKAGFENLPVDLNEQDGLAKHEAVTRSPSVYVDENSETVETSPQNLDKASEFPVQEHSPETKDWIASSPNPVPIELIRQFPSEEQIVNIGGARSVFARTEKPFTIQTIAPLRLRHTTPEGLPLDSPILRPIWDH